MSQAQVEIYTLPLSRKKYTCQVEVTEVKVSALEEQLAKVTADRQRLERREGTLTTQVGSLVGSLVGVVVEKECLSPNTNIN